MRNSFAAKKPAWGPLLAFLFTFCLSFRAQGCEPIVPLYLLLSGPSVAGPALTTHALPWLFVAVAIKCGTFAFLNHRLAWYKAVLYMLIANVISTIPGVLIGVLTSSLVGALIAVILLSALGWMVQGRVLLLQKPGAKSWISAEASAVFFVAFFFISVATFVLAEKALQGRSFVSYWLLKFLFVAMVACTGIVISAVVEECVIGGLSFKSLGNVSFYTPVFRANYVTLGVILFVAAIEMLPKRLTSPHFLVSWLHSILAMLCFT